MQIALAITKYLRRLAIHIPHFIQCTYLYCIHRHFNWIFEFPPKWAEYSWIAEYTRCHLVSGHRAILHASFFFFFLFRLFHSDLITCIRIECIGNKTAIASSLNCHIICSSKDNTDYYLHISSHYYQSKVESIFNIAASYGLCINYSNKKYFFLT